MRTKNRTGRKKSQRAKPVYNKLPTKVTRKEFNRYVNPHLSTGSRGPDTVVSRYKLFCYILYVLHTGIQWEQLPCRGISWQAVYYHHNRWSKDGSYARLFDGSLDFLCEQDDLDLAALHGDGSNVVAKKGALASVIQGTSTSGAKNPLISKTIQAMSSYPVSRRR